MRAKQFLSEVMRTAWQFVRRDGQSLSEALRVAWRNTRLVIAMRTKDVSFCYRKVDGTIREAIGTLRSRFVGKDSDTIQIYFDVDKQAWRSFRKVNLLSIN